MVYPLTSPGTSVTITDETPYATAGQGTVPLIIIGTHEYKTLPSGSGVAEGTLPENANTLYPITSQRELLQTFGNPIFYAKNNTSVHGYELNEYGLHAAYQYLGVANKAYVIRSAIDYAQMLPRSTEPRSEAVHGTAWLDTQNNSWGFYEYGNGEWVERDLWVVEDLASLDSGKPSQVDTQFVPLIPAAADKDLAIVVYYDKKVLYQKLGAGWYVVGSSAWATTKGGSATLRYNSFRPEAGVTGDILVLETPSVISSISSVPTWLLKTFNVNTGAWDETLVPIYPSAKEATLTKTIGSVFLSHDPTKAIFEFRNYDGTSWKTLDPVSGADEPTGPPEDGTLWYNSLNLRAEVKVSQGGAWVNYQVAHPDTDPRGVILLGSQPYAQTDGTPLVEGDIWLNTSDLENYPKLYRRHSNTWEAINTTNSLDPATGIVFGEANAINALNYPEGMKLFDMAASNNDIKQYSAASDSWTNVSGYQPNGVPFFGRKAQRQMIVRALGGTISSNENIRAETVYFNLIAAPGYVELIDEMVILNTDMKEVAFIVADTPIRLEPTGTAIAQFANNSAGGNTETGVATFNPYVGMYYPWGLGTNVDGNEIMIPPSTIALRTLAYSDSISYQWMAPAGFTRGLVTNAATVGYLDSNNAFRSAQLNEGQRSILYSNGINPIAYVPNRGLVLYGQKTRHNLDTALNRINVARLVNYLRFNLDVLSKPFLFEPNDFQTRDSVKTTFERFMSNLVGLRGLYDYVVVCDDSNNTPERIDRHELWVDIAIKPVQTVEFIYIPVRIVATGADLGGLFG